MTRLFTWFNLSQAIGALIDNAFKMVTVIYLVNTLHRNLTETLSLATALLVLPFLLFSNWAGALTDRYAKRSLVITVKWAELILLLFSFLALHTGLAWPMLTLLFLLAAQSAFFGPVKRGIVPELVGAEELSRANGQLTAASYLAIVLGIFLPSLMVTVWHLSGFAVLAVCVALSSVGLLCAYSLPPAPAANSMSSPSPWIIPDAVRAMRSLTPHPWLKRAALGSIAFSGIAALFQQNLVVYAREVAGLSVEASGFLFLVVACGIASGAWLTGRLSRHTIEIGLIPVGALSLALSFCGLGLARGIVEMAALLFLAGTSAGMCVVPLTAYIQSQAPADSRGKIFGAIEFWSFTAMVLASGLFYAMLNLLHCDARSCMLLTGSIGALAAAWALARLPGFTVRFLLSRLTRLFYRIEVHGLENLPSEGGALLVSNHIAYGDATIIQSVTPRQIRYVMSRDIFKSWGWCRPLFKLTGAIPIHTSDGPRALVQSLANARDALQKGALVGIFPEGELTRTGTMQPFHKGFERIVKDTGRPVIPIHLDNLWGSIFSFCHGEPGLRWPRRLPLRVTVRIGKPLPSTAAAADVQLAIAELGADTAAARAARPGNTLSLRFLATARSRWFRTIASDTTGRETSYGRLLTAAVILNARLSPHLASARNIGILLPPSVAGLLANAALTLQGKTVVNFNWTVSAEAFRSAVDQSGVRHIITSRGFIGNVALPAHNARLLYIEDLLSGLTIRERLTSALRACFAPGRRLAAGHAPSPSDTACIIFSSGSTGMPKGVRLSHANLLSNIDSLHTVLRFTHSDSLCATLPLFHSFGYLGTLWWPLLKGIRTAYHTNPLQTAHVLRLIRERRLTILLTTPTLLQGYLRRATGHELASLRHVLTGGEKLPAHVADACERLLGIRPLEGYGATELSPVAVLSLPNRTAGNTRCIGSKPASAGRPLPNVAIKVVDPESGATLPADTPGLLLVKGPNVMQGYLNNPDKTAEVLSDGWYNTGDIARIDGDGFVFLTDRLSRFSKIGGEMVPHGAIEEALQKICGLSEPCVAVISAPDDAENEDLVVCYTPQAGDPEALFHALKRSGLPNLWIPRRTNFLKIGSIPLLGTGKTDLRSLRDYVLQARRLCA